MSFFQMLIPLLTAFIFNYSPSIMLNFGNNYKHSCLNPYFNGSAPRLPIVRMMFVYFC